MENKSIYQYIIANLDAEEQRFTQAILPDEPHPAIPHPLGAEDAFWLNTNLPSDERGAKNIVKLLQNFQAYPDQPHKQKLYEALSSNSVIAMLEPLCDMLQEIEITEDIVALARSFLYNSRHRGPIKFAYIIFGLFGVELLREKDPDLWEDMFKVAHCEEFTYFFIFTCSLTNVTPFKEIWRLIGCTEGWGKVFAIEAVECRDEAQELWLIQHGMEISVDYPALAVPILKAAHLASYLAQEEMDERTFKGAGVLLNAFLALVVNHDESVWENNSNTAVVKPEQLVRDYLRHAEQLAVKPEDLLQVLNLSLGLRNLQESEGLCVIPENSLELLRARCDSLVYKLDWSAYLKDNLIKNDRVNYELCDLACEMELDIWMPLFDYLCEHPYEYNIMPYLFSYPDPCYQEMIMHFVEHNLSLYSTEETALLVPLRYLAYQPGKGEKVIIAGLLSLYDWPRGIACTTLNEWPSDCLTEPIRQALRQALYLSNSEVITARIEDLLQGIKFDIEELFTR